MSWKEINIEELEQREGCLTRVPLVGRLFTPSVSSMSYEDWLKEGGGNRRDRGITRLHQPLLDEEWLDRYGEIVEDIDHQKLSYLISSGNMGNNSELVDAFLNHPDPAVVLKVSCGIKLSAAQMKVAAKNLGGIFCEDHKLLGKELGVVADSQRKHHGSRLNLEDVILSLADEADRAARSKRQELGIR